MDTTGADIPNLDLELAERLAETCPDEHGMGPQFGSPMFACHQSRPEREVVCAGWLASVGINHPSVRLGIHSGRFAREMTKPGPGWPALHTDFRPVISKLRRLFGATDTTTKGRE